MQNTSSVVVLVGLLLGFILAVVIAPADWAAWFLIGLSFAILFVSNPIRRDSSLFVGVFSVIALHHLVSLINAYGVTLPGADLDAITFHETASGLISEDELHLAVGFEFYQNLLGALYLLTGSSLIVGQSLSVLAFSFCCVLFVRFLDLFEVADARWLPLLIFGMLPSTALLTSFTLREVWELLFFMLSVYCAVRFVVGRDHRFLAGMIGSALGLGVFHKALALYGVCFVLAVVGFSMSGLNGRMHARLRLLILLAVVGLSVLAGYWMIIYTAVGSRLVSHLVGYGPVDYIYLYRMQIDFLGEPRSAFGLAFDTTTVLATFLTFFKIYGYYLFAPFENGVGGFKDVYASVEATLRLVFIMSSMVVCWYARGTGNHRYTLLLFAYVTMTFMWALGTTNVGQAMRHHVLTNWIIILAGAPSLVRCFQARR